MQGWSDVGRYYLGLGVFVRCRLGSETLMRSHGLFASSRVETEPHKLTIINCPNPRPGADVQYPLGTFVLGRETQFVLQGEAEEIVL